MKIILLLLFFAGIFTSCEQTNKQSNATKNPDTVVIKNDTAIKRTDTTGFKKN